MLDLSRKDGWKSIIFHCPLAVCSGLQRHLLHFASMEFEFAKDTRSFCPGSQVGLPHHHGKLVAWIYLDFKWFQVISRSEAWAPLKSNASSPPIGVSLSSRCRWNGGHSGAICIHLLCLQTFGWWKKKNGSLVVSSTRLPGATFASICISTQALPNAVKSFSGLLHALDCDICIKRIQKWTPKPQQALVCASVHMDTLNLLFAETNISVRWHYLEAGLWFCDVEFHFAFCHDSNCTGPLNQTPAVWGKVAMWASCNFWRVCPTSKLWMFGMKKNWHRLFQIPEKKHSDSMIQFWRLSLPSPYWDSMIYIYIVISINGGIPLSLDAFGKIP